MVILSNTSYVLNIIRIIAIDRFIAVLLFISIGQGGLGQSLSSISPSVGAQGQFLSVTVTASGTLFTQSTGTINNGWLNKNANVIPITNLTIDNDTMFSGVVALSCSTQTGLWKVNYYYTDSQGNLIDTLTLANGFEVKPAGITSVYPNQGYQGFDLTVSVTNGCDLFAQSSGTINKAWLNKGIEDIDLVGLSVVNPNYFTGVVPISCTTSEGSWDLYYCKFDSMTQTYDTLTMVQSIPISDPMVPDCAEPCDSLMVTVTNPNVLFTQSTSTLNKAWLNNGIGQIDFTNITVTTNTIAGDLNVPCSADTGGWTVYLCQTDTVAGTADTVVMPCPFVIGCGFVRYGEFVPNDIEAVSVIPNPFTQQAVLRFPNPENGEAEFKLYSIHGRIVAKVSGIREDIIQIDRKHLPPGVYLYTIAVENGGMFSGKVLVR